MIAANDEDLFKVIALAILVGGGLLFMFLRARTRIAEKRLDVIRDLAKLGQVPQAEIEKFFNPKKRLWNVILVLAWFALLAGGGLLCAALAQDWPNRYSDFGPAGLALLGFALATMSTPIMLKEFRRQGMA